MHPIWFILCLILGVALGIAIGLLWVGLAVLLVSPVIAIVLMVRQG